MTAGDNDDDMIRRRNDGCQRIVVVFVNEVGHLTLSPTAAVAEIADAATGIFKDEFLDRLLVPSSFVEPLGGFRGLLAPCPAVNRSIWHPSSNGSPLGQIRVVARCQG